MKVRSSFCSIYRCCARNAIGVIMRKVYRMKDRRATNALLKHLLPNPRVFQADRAGIASFDTVVVHSRPGHGQGQIS